MSAIRSLARVLVVACALVAALAGTARAQYRAAGSDLQVAGDRQQQVRDSMHEARYRLGPFRVAPWIGLRDVTYQDHVITAAGEETSDVTATGGAGAHFYLPMGRKVVLAAHALPEYTWWHKLSNRNQTIGRYGVGLFGDMNRLKLELTGQRTEDLQYASSDLLIREPVRTDRPRGAPSCGWGARSRCSPPARVSQVRMLGYDQLPAFYQGTLLDRDHRQVRGELQYLFRGDTGWIGVGAQSERTEFVSSEAGRDNEGTSLVAEMRLRGNRLDVDLDWVQRDLQAANGSDFPGFKGSTGKGLLNLRMGWRLEGQLYAVRALDYSGVDIGTFLESKRYGVGLRSKAGRKGSLQLFYETGQDRYFGDPLLSRTDDVSAYGAMLEMPVSEHVTLQLGSRRTKFDSPLPGFDRQIREITASLAFGLGSYREW